MEAGLLIAEVVPSLALMRHIQKADGPISGHLGLRTAYLNTRPRESFVMTTMRALTLLIPTSTANRFSEFLFTKVLQSRRH